MDMSKKQFAFAMVAKNRRVVSAMVTKGTAEVAGVRGFSLRGSRGGEKEPTAALQL